MEAVSAYHSVVELLLDRWLAAIAPLLYPGFSTTRECASHRTHNTVPQSNWQEM
jgi:hypothetical protein